MRALRLIVPLLVLVASSAHAQTEQRAQPSPGALVEQGYSLAETYCASCHAIGVRGPSPNPMATPWRTLSNAYPTDPLAEAFAQGRVVGHPDMPRFRLTPRQVDALTAYMRSIQTRHRDGE